MLALYKFSVLFSELIFQHENKFSGFQVTYNMVNIEMH